MKGLRSAAATDVGLVRDNNQDSLLVAAPLFAVADGMGGHAAGEVASATAVAALCRSFVSAPSPSPQALSDAARAANRAVWDRAIGRPELRGMGTTLVALALVPDDDREDRVAVINVGDSRVYLMRDDELRQLTDDHSLVAELVAQGQIAAEEAEFHPQRHVLTRALGVDPDVDVDLVVLRAQAHDRFLLCSDGLSRDVSDQEIAAVLRRLADPDETARELVSEARMRGGSDNITVVVVEVIDAVPETPPADQPADPPADPPERTTALAALAASSPVDVAEKPVPPEAPKTRVFTLRVASFVGALLAIVALAVVGIGWYARASYFVGVADGQLTIYKGRPGGLLWFAPTVARRTGVSTGQVESRHLDDLRAGKPEASLVAAQQYLDNLTREYAAAQTGRQPATAPAGTSPPAPAPAPAPASGSTVAPAGTPTS